MSYQFGRLFIGKEERRRWLLSLIFQEYLRKIKVPEYFDYEKLVLGTDYKFPILDQDGVGACTVFSAGTSQMRFEFAEQGPVEFPIFRFADLIYTYDEIKQPGEGAYMTDLMAIWNHEGLRHRKCHTVSNRLARWLCHFLKSYDWYKIQNYTNIQTDEVADIKAAIYLFGQVEIGILVTDGFMSAFLKRRDVTKSDADGRVLGGHAMNCVGYDSKGIYVNHTWRGGFKQRIRWDYCQHVNEAYGIRLLDEAWGVVDAKNPKLLRFFDLEKFYRDAEWALTK